MVITMSDRKPPGFDSFDKTMRGLIQVTKTEAEALDRRQKKVKARAKAKRRKTA